MRGATDGTWRFGPFEAQINNGWQKSRTLEVGDGDSTEHGLAVNYSSGDDRIPYAFSLAAEGVERVAARCLMKGRHSQVSIGDYASATQSWGVECMLRPRGGSPIRLCFGDPESFAQCHALLEVSPTPIHVAASMALATADGTRLASAGNPSGPAGFLFTKDDQVVGAVDAVNQGIVYLRDDVEDDERTLLASAAVALAVFVDRM